MDLITASLYPLRDEIVYIEQPCRFVQGVLVFWLQRVFYGLKQAPKVWYFIIWDFLKQKKFTPKDSDQSLFISAYKQLFFAIYVNDLFSFGANKTKINVLKKILSSCFGMTDMEHMSQYLGMEICYDREKDTLMLLQTACLKVVFERFWMSDCNLSSTSMDKSLPKTIIISSFFDYQALFETIF